MSTANGTAAPGTETAWVVAEPERRRTRPVEVRPGLVLGGTEIVITAGPCAVESYEQTLVTAQAVAAAGARLLRGGAYKPRTSPHSFQGLGPAGLEILAEVSRVVGLPTVTEVLSPNDVDLVTRHADVLQVGSRNMHNVALLHAVGESGRPILLKRGFMATIEEWLLAAEHIRARGNEAIILCERGIRTFEPATRFTLDINAVGVAQSMSDLPVVVDPSHSTGRPDLVVRGARAAIAAGADGLLVEVHPDPAHALSDGYQALTPGQFASLMSTLERVATAVERRLSLCAS